MLKRIANIVLFSTIISIIFLAFPRMEAHALWGKGSNLSKEDYSKLVKDNLELKNQVDAIKKDYEDSKERYKILLDKVKSMQQERETLNKSVSELSTNLSDRERAMAEARESISAAKKEKAEIEEAKKAMEGPPNRALDKKYKEEITKLKRSLADSAARENALTSEKQNAEKELDRLAKTEKTQSEGLKKAIADLDSVKREIRERETAAKESEDRLKSARADKAQSEKDLERLRSDLKAKEDELHKLNALRMETDKKSVDLTRLQSLL